MSKDILKKKALMDFVNSYFWCLVQFFCITQYCNDLFKQKELEPKSVDFITYPEDQGDPAHYILNYLFVLNKNTHTVYERVQCQNEGAL